MNFRGRPLCFRLHYVACGVQGFIAEGSPGGIPGESRGNPGPDEMFPLLGLNAVAHLRIAEPIVRLGSRWRNQASSPVSSDFPGGCGTGHITSGSAAVISSYRIVRPICRAETVEIHVWVRFVKSRSGDVVRFVISPRCREAARRIPFSTMAYAELGSNGKIADRTASASERSDLRQPKRAPRSR